MTAKAIKRILLATDFSEASEGAVEQAIDLASTFDALVDVVHVQPPLAYPITIGFTPSAQQKDLIVSWVETSLSQVAARVRKAGVPCETTSLAGNPHVEIVEHALNSKPDLIVLGTHGRTGISHVVLGSVAERVIQKAPCPVLVVPQNQETA